MKIKFWGARGSLPAPERRNSRYGGNTPCVEIRLANGTLVILDCGTGLRALGKSLMREFGDHPIHGSIFLTHFHWDHIQGIPFFLPLYKKGNIFMFHSALCNGMETKRAIEGEMTAPYFPVEMGAMASTRHFRDLNGGPINLNGAIISSALLNHPQGCAGYRIEADGGVFVLASDTEPGSPVHDRAVRELALGADVLAYDAQYTPEQLQSEKKGWGHGSWLEGTRIARENGVKRLILFHHDPDHEDSFIDLLVERAREQFPNVSAASEGMEIELPRGQMRRAKLVAGADRRRERRYHLELPLRLTWSGLYAKGMLGRGLSQDISRSGIYFVAPVDINTEQPVEVEVLLPDEITHRGELTLRFLAQAVRKRPVDGELGHSMPSVGIAAKLVAFERRASPNAPLSAE